MIDKEAILKRVTDIEDRLLVNNILDKAAKAERSREVVHTDFLDPRQKNLVDKCLKTNINISYSFNGGYIGAERNILIFYPDFLAYDDCYCTGETFENAILKAVRIEHACKNK